MKVEIVGGGPAGLYLAILLRKADRGVDVRVLERNPPDATFGFGVVFSEETLGALRDADPETHLEITDTFARWDRIDIRFGGREVSSRGHSFSAIARKRLLEILQARCRELGADARVRRRGRGAARRRPRRRRRRRQQPRPRPPRLRDEGSDRGQQVRLVRHRPRLRRVHVRLPRDRARPLQRPRVPVRRADVDLHRRVPGGGVARGRAGRDGRGGEPRVLRAAVRERAARPRAVLEPLALARLPEGHERDLAWRERRHARRRGAHGALLDRLRHEARDGGLDRARSRARAAALGRRGRARRLRARARAARRADAGGGERERRVLRAHRELLAPRADPVRVQPDHAERPDHARDARRARPAVHARARLVARRAGRLAAARVLAVRAAWRPVRQPVRARRERGGRERGGPDVRRGRASGPRASSCFA